jgi:hypothetical protein
VGPGDGDQERRDGRHRRETDELIEVFRDLGERGVDILTIGQYLRPSKDHLPMTRYYTPAEFVSLKEEALKFGFKHVESGPLVRSSYHAHEQAEVAADKRCSSFAIRCSQKRSPLHFERRPKWL